MLDIDFIWILFWFQKFVLMNDLIESCDVLFLNIVEVWTIIYIWLKARRALKFDLVLRDLVTDPERLNSKHYFWTTKILYFYIQYWNQFINRILPINEHIFAETRMPSVTAWNFLLFNSGIYTYIHVCKLIHHVHRFVFGIFVCSFWFRIRLCPGFSVASFPPGSLLSSRFANIGLNR